MSDDTVEVEIHVPTLHKGVEPSSGPTVVKRLQHMLNDRGLGPLAKDGDFGPKTEAAVKAFQGHQGIGVDGVVGQHTWAALLDAWLLFSEPG